MVHMLNRSFIFDFLCSVGFHLGFLPRWEGKTGFGLSQTEPCSGENLLCGAVASEMSRTEPGLLFIVKGREESRSSMIRFFILTSALMFGERRPIPARSILLKAVGIPRCTVKSPATIAAAIRPFARDG